MTTPSIDRHTPRTCRFGELTVEFDERVLTPRDWTLEQSHWAVELAAQAGPGPILEVCAGAGHIGLAAAVAAGRDLVQVEADPVAAEYARRNAGRAGWSARTDVRNSPMHQALAPGECFPLIIADPPYLPSGTVSRWPEDPVSAIDGGPDGLRLVKDCLALAAGHLVPGGSMLLQLAGPGQVGAVRRVLSGSAGSDLVPGEERVIDADRAILQIVADTQRGCGGTAAPGTLSV